MGLQRILELPATAAIAGLTIFAPLAAPAADGDFDLAPASVSADRIVAGGPAKDGIAAILSPHFLSPAEADFLTSEDRVIGIASDGQAKAYPLRIMNWHQVVNDTFAGGPIAVTYCPLSGSAVVFDRLVRGAAHTFGVSGRLYEGNIVLYDHQTESLWSQLGGTALTGKRMGSRLGEIPSVVTTWSEWLARNPTTLVLSADTEHPRDYTLNPYIAYEAADRLMFRPSRDDTRLAPKEKVLGIVMGEHARAYPFAELARAGSEVEDHVADKDVTIAFDGASASATAGGTLLPATTAYWFAWAAFHPSTGIWIAPRVEPLPGPVRNEDVRIEETKSYWTQLPCTLTSDPDHQQFGAAGLFVISGKLKNFSDLPLHHIRLRFELLDPSGQVLYHEEGYNRAAESLMELEDGAVADGEANDIREIPPGGSDTFRMIMIGDEIPPFDHSGVSVVSAR